jgi:acyl-CoA dehydrogenase
MPTAELALEGTVAHLVGAVDGTRNITPMLAITRLWNSVIAASGLRRASRWPATTPPGGSPSGAPLIDHPLHQTTLAWLRVQHEASLQLAFRAVELLGREEAGVATEQERAGAAAAAARSRS